MKKIVLFAVPVICLSSCVPPSHTNTGGSPLTEDYNKYIENASEVEMRIMQHTNELEQKGEKYLTLEGCKLLAQGEYASCVDAAINAISSDFVKSCILANIEKNKEVFEEMQNLTLSKWSLQNILELEKECVYYNELENPTQKPTQTATGATGSTQTVPLFATFATAAAGAYLASYLSNKQFAAYANSSARVNEYYGNQKYYCATPAGKRDKECNAHTRTPTPYTYYYWAFGGGGGSGKDVATTLREVEHQRITDTVSKRTPISNVEKSWTYKMTTIKGGKAGTASTNWQTLSAKTMSAKKSAVSSIKASSGLSGKSGGGSRAGSYGSSGGKGSLG